MNLDLMRLINEQFFETPFYGARQMIWHLRNEGRLVNEKRVRRLMRLMDLMPIHGPKGVCAAQRRKGNRSPKPTRQRRGIRFTRFYCMGYE